MLVAEALPLEETPGILGRGVLHHRHPLIRHVLQLTGGQLDRVNRLHVLVEVEGRRLRVPLVQRATDLHPRQR